MASVCFRLKTKAETETETWLARVFTFSDVDNNKWGEEQRANEKGTKMRIFAFPSQRRESNGGGGARRAPAGARCFGAERNDYKHIIYEWEKYHIKAYFHSLAVVLFNNK